MKKWAVISSPDTFNKYQVWFFPAFVVTVLLLLTIFRIHGSSIGVYNDVVNGPGSHDPSLLFGKPRPIRSDEWLVNTQTTIAQDNNDYERINENIGDGADVSLLLDAPYKDWSSVFKPHSLSFFVLPFEHAFAFRWWLLGASLLLSCYALILTLFKRQVLNAILLSLVCLFNPFVFWWYMPGTVLPFTYGFLAITLAVLIFRSKSALKRLLLSFVLAYVMVCFALILYPPFQIAVALVIACFLVGYVLSQRTQIANFKKHLLKLLPYFAGSLGVALVITGLFFITRIEAVQAIANTVYPGTRKIVSGGMTPLPLFSSFLSHNLLVDRSLPHSVFTNQSGISSILIPTIYLLPFSITAIVLEKIHKKRLNWVLIGLSAVITLFLLRMFVPWPDFIYRFLLLDRVQHKRLIIGLGFAGILLIPYLATSLSEVRTSIKSVAVRKKLLVLPALMFAVVFCVSMITGLYIREQVPEFISNIYKIILLAGIFASASALLLTKWFQAGLVLFILFGLISVYKVHPVYQGFGVVRNSPIINSMNEHVVTADDGTSDWGVVEIVQMENFPAMAGFRSYSGVFFYPQLDTWRKFDIGQDEEDIYNRYSHVTFSADTSRFADDEQFHLNQTDSVSIKLDPCGPEQKHIENFLSLNKLEFSCLEEKDAIDTIYGKIRIYTRTDAN